MQPVTNLALQVTAIHAVIGLQVTDDRFDGVTPFDEFALGLAQALGLATMNDGQARVVSIHTSVAQIDDRRGWFLARILHENGGLFDLFVQRMPIKRCP
jgi:hypothetical protein